MTKKSLRNWILACLVIAPVLCPAGVQAQTAALTDLNKAFLQAYGMATKEKLKQLRANAPLFVNRFGQIAVYLPGQDVAKTYSMEMELYLETRAISHTVAAVYARLAPFGFGQLDEPRLAWLRNYRNLLLKVEQEIPTLQYVPQDLQRTQLAMLEKVRRAVEGILQTGQVQADVLDALGASVRPDIEANLQAAATDQLTRFRIQLGKWNEETGTNVKWKESVAVIIGIHQARNEYLQWQFFNWALQDDPHEQNNVVFAETLTVPPAVDNAPQAIELLSKVMFDKDLGKAVFDDRLRMQSDVLGPAAEKVLQGWGPPPGVK